MPENVLAFIVVKSQNPNVRVFVNWTREIMWLIIYYYTQCLASKTLRNRLRYVQPGCAGFVFFYVAVWKCDFHLKSPLCDIVIRIIKPKSQNCLRYGNTKLR